MKLTHPLQELIDAKRSQREVATALRITPQYLSDLLKSNRSVGAKVALRVQKAFGVDAMAILIRQAAIDLEAARKELAVEGMGTIRKRPTKNGRPS